MSLRSWLSSCGSALPCIGEPFVVDQRRGAYSEECSLGGSADIDVSRGVTVNQGAPNGGVLP